MANREELGIIRRARAGRASAQVELGKLYLVGSAGLPNSLPTALHWLERAARQDYAEAWELIGAFIPYDVARQGGRSLACWYERAHDAGVARAGLVLAQLVLDGEGEADEALRAKAWSALAEAAAAGVPDAQQLLARQRARQHPLPPQRPTGPAAAHGADTLRRTIDAHTLRQGAGGPDQAQFALLERAWEARQWQRYLQHALPLARVLLQGADKLGMRAPRLAPQEVSLLSRCARLLEGGPPGGDSVPGELRRIWELAASAYDRHAQLAVGLAYARMRVDGQRTPAGSGPANFKKAIRWLGLAADQGLAEAWYALSRIYIKPEFSQRNVADAQKFLERAAEMGYRDAQLECGNNAWRARREHENNDVRAVYWLQKAAAQGCPRALAALRKIAPRTEAALHAENGGAEPSHALADSHPLLAARLELAAMFRLTRAEALLLDIRGADRGHCLVIDIRASYGRSKRRLVLVETAQQRQALDRIGCLFEHVDAGPGGPEGNYRQRLYRLKTLAPDGREPERYDLAA